MPLPMAILQPMWTRFHSTAVGQPTHGKGMLSFSELSAVLRTLLRPHRSESHPMTVITQMA
tara:strand:- start:1955 stop:2137 length:183 start_codon:yes stop_codon:yes gene_type:complete